MKVWTLCLDVLFSLVVEDRMFDHISPIVSRPV